MFLLLICLTLVRYLVQPEELKGEKDHYFSSPTLTNLSAVKILQRIWKVRNSTSQKGFSLDPFHVHVMLD